MYLKQIFKKFLKLHQKSFPSKKIQMILQQNINQKNSTFLNKQNYRHNFNFQEFQQDDHIHKEHIQKQLAFRQQDLNFNKEAIFIENLKKNSHKVQQLVNQLQQIRKDNILKSKIIENSLKKELKLKLIISEMQMQVSILMQQKNQLQMRILQQEESKGKNNDLAVRSIMGKFKNCIEENQMLRNQIKFPKTNNIFLLEIQNKEQKQKLESLEVLTVSLKQQNKLLKKELENLENQLIDFQKCKSDCHFLKLQNMKIHSEVQFKLAQQQQFVKKMMKQLSEAKVSKELWQQKYDQLSQIIKVVDQMRQTYKFNKKHQNFLKNDQVDFKNYCKSLFQQTRC